MAKADQLVLTPQLQLAIRMLAMSQAELFAMVAEWPGAIADLAPGELAIATAPAAVDAVTVREIEATGRIG